MKQSEKGMLMFGCVRQSAADASLQCVVCT